MAEWFKAPILKIGIPLNGINGLNPFSTEFFFYYSKGEWQRTSTKVTYKASSHRFMDKLEKLSKQLMIAATKFDFNKVLTFHADINDRSNQTYTFSFTKDENHNPKNIFMVFLKNSKMNPDDSYIDFFKMSDKDSNFRVWRNEFPKEFDEIATILELKAIEQIDASKEKLANDFLNEMI